MDTFVSYVKKNRIAAIATAIFLVVVLVVVLIIMSVRRGSDKEGFRLQREVLTQQRNMTITLSTCLAKTNVAAQVTTQQYDSIKDILTSVVAARYVDANGNATRANTALGGGAFVSSLNEQYPTIDTTTWTRLLDTAVGCQEDTGDAQKKLQTLAGNFETWTHSGNIFTDGIRRHWPNNELTAYDAIHNKKIYGKEALEWYTTPILTTDAQTAVGTHTLPTQKLFGPSPSTSPTK